MGGRREGETWNESGCLPTQRKELESAAVRKKDTGMDRRWMEREQRYREHWLALRGDADVTVCGDEATKTRRRRSLTLEKGK